MREVILFLVKGLGVWLVMVAAAIGNGLLRETLLVPWLGGGISLPLSGILLALLIFAIAYMCLPIFGRQSQREYLGIGFFWCGLTVLFEFGFGHYIVGKSWQEIWQGFNPARGNLFCLVLVVTLFSPWLAARLRNA